MKLIKYFLVALFLTIKGTHGSSTEHGSNRTVTIHRTEMDRRLRNCPLQCRCIELRHLGQRYMAQRWRTMAQVQGTVHFGWRATEIPDIFQAGATIQGRDMICVGLKEVPYPLEKGKLLSDKIARISTCACMNNIHEPCQVISNNVAF